MTAAQDAVAAGGADGAGAAPAPPSITVLGETTPEQLAALVAVLSGLTGPGAEPPAAPPSRWAARDRLVREPVRPGRGGWRASTLPR